MIKKFTLRPSRLVINRPISPDSPSADVDGVDPETSQEINFNTSKEIYISPDSNVCQVCPHCADDSFKTAHDEISFTKVCMKTITELFLTAFYRYIYFFVRKRKFYQDNLFDMDKSDIFV